MPRVYDAFTCAEGHTKGNVAGLLWLMRLSGGLTRLAALRVR
jgi:hypothetical protein